MKTFFIADTHFGDDNIRRYENRPFQNIEEMDTAIISNWNSVVSDDDCVYVLGDFGAVGYEKDVLDKLNGKKYLIKVTMISNLMKSTVRQVSKKFMICLNL